MKHILLTPTRTPGKPLSSCWYHPTLGLLGAVCLFVASCSSSLNDRLFFSSEPATTVIAGSNYSYQVDVSASLSSATFTLETAPSGMTVGANGLVTWSPTNSDIGSHPIRLRAQKGSKRGEQTWTLEVLPVPVQFSGEPDGPPINDLGADQRRPTAGHSFVEPVDNVTVKRSIPQRQTPGMATFDQAVEEDVSVASNSHQSNGDSLTYILTQVGGIGVTIAGKFTTPPGDQAFTFDLSVEDAHDGLVCDHVAVQAHDAWDLPIFAFAMPSMGKAWPSSNGLVAVSILGWSNPENEVTISYDLVGPVIAERSSDKVVDTFIQADGTVLFPNGLLDDGNNLVYRIHFTASNQEGSASGVVRVNVGQASFIANGSHDNSTN